MRKSIDGAASGQRAPRAGGAMLLGALSALTIIGASGWQLSPATAQDTSPPLDVPSARAASPVTATGPGSDGAGAADASRPQDPPSVDRAPSTAEPAAVPVNAGEGGERATTSSASDAAAAPPAPVAATPAASAPTPSAPGSSTPDKGADSGGTDRPPADRPAVTRAPAEPLPAKTLRLAVKAGAHREAQKRAVHAVFAARNGFPITIVPWPATGSPLDELVKGKAAWDVAEVGVDEARRACDAGLLERIDPAGLVPTPDGAAVDKDYIAGGLTPCAVASVAWSTLVAFDQKAWPPRPQPARASKRGKTETPATARLPETLKDLFDVAAFPGKRALRRDARHLLEASLIADGVPPEEVYPSLATETGAHRAFRRLEVLRGHAVWAETPTAASKALADRTAVMAMTFNGRAFHHVAVEAKSYGLIWDGQIYHIEAWVIAKGTPNGAAAHSFLALASDPVRQAEQAALFPYGPPRASAVARVGRHPVLKTEMSRYLPTAPANLRTALQFDGAFWRQHGPRLDAMFEAWLKAPLPAPVEAAGPAAKPEAPGETPAGETPLKSGRSPG